MPSQCYDKTPTKYLNLLPIFNEDFIPNSSSDSYSEDSGSDYIPPFQSPTSDNCNSSEVFSDISDLNIDQFVNEDEYNLCEPSTSFTDPNEKQNLQKQVIDSEKKIKKGYNFTGSVEISKKKQLNNKRCWDKIDNCIFCEKNVTNFTRHIIRNHSTEMEVARYLSLKKGSKDRKKLADELRKRGNFLFNIGGEQKIKPVRRPNMFSVTSDATQYLPCKYCYGLYKRLYLFRHIKHCKSKISEPKQGRNNRAQADAHNILLAFTDNDTQLVNEVFPRMAVDAISTVAKTDHLIKAFGSRYLKCHKEKHLINVVSQKMRTLARLVIQMKVEVPGIKSLQDYLVPKYFDYIIKCTKIVAGYDTSTDTFGSPSVVLKMGSSLKQCCDIAEFNLLKNCDNLVLDEQQRNIQHSIINLRSIIDKQWSYEVSTNASKEMYQKKWNKPAYLPLTSDIMLFRNHLIDIQNQCVKALKIDFNNLKAYKELQESILAQLILLNRRRSGEVQRIFLETYISAPSEVSQEEVESSLSEMERHLTHQFKRIVIRGKRGRGVPILFTPSLQKSIKLLLETRKVTNYIDKKNTYLFALPNSMSCLRGSDAIRKLSKDCGAKNPENLTSTRLRKQVATVAQLLNLSESDIEQLATFMGHSKEVHKQFYRLSESTFQVAKVSKLLLMMEKGQGQEYRGKSLDEIDINIDSLVTDIEESSDEEIDHSEKKIPLMASTKNNKPEEKKHVRVSWSEEEKKVTREYFQKHILLNKAPKKEECNALKIKYPQLFENKPWKKIKTFIHNVYNKTKK